MKREGESFEARERRELGHKRRDEVQLILIALLAIAAVGVAVWAYSNVGGASVKDPDMSSGEAFRDQHQQSTR